MKIGIITHYYKSTNYGGNLQSYALCAYLKEKGYQVEQICYNPKSIIRSNHNMREKCTGIIKKLYSAWVNRRDILICKILYQRKKAIYKFNKEIPHSSKVYTSGTIVRCKNDYNAYITGSDQVWHPNAVCSAYLLQFTEQNKISYAASLSVEEISTEQIKIFKNSLSSYKKISVREESAINMLSRYIDKKIEWVVDPTLLLSGKDWNNLCDNRIIIENYVFCYFLGDGLKERNLAVSFAQKYNLKIVTIPYLNNHYRKCDKSYGDIRLSNISPKAFLSLIKYADYIFTDSFHGTIFSGIFNCHFVAFGRSEYAGMDDRLKSLLKLFNAERCFCDSVEKISLEYIETIFSETKQYETNLLREQIKSSKIFLEEALKVQ